MYNLYKIDKLYKLYILISLKTQLSRTRSRQPAAQFFHPP